MKSISIKPWLSGRLLMIAMFITCSGPMVAQDETAEVEPETTAKSFSLVYIAQDPSSMPVEEIERKLLSAWNRAVQDCRTIFYLSRGREEPVIVKVNTEDDNRADFDEVLLPAIREEIPYSVDVPHDKNKILELLRENSIVNPDGTPVYEETYFDFHVGQEFWTVGYNEAFLAALFFELSIKQHDADNFHYNVFCPRDVKFNKNAGPFGLLNPDDCRRNINLDKSY